MVALLDDAAAVEHDQPVHRRDGREPVRDRHHRLALHQRVQAGLDRRLDLGVERAGGLVEQQDRCVLQDHPRDGDALALPARELDAALADLRVVAAAPGRVGELADEAVGLGAARGLDHLGVARVRAAVQDVVAHRAVQQRGVLRDHADLRAQAVLGDGGDVLAVDQDAPALQVMEAQQQMGQRRLARAGAPDQADPLARADVQVHVADQRLALPRLAVAEADALEADLAARHRQRGRARPVDHPARLRQRGQAVLHRADVLEQAGHLPHHPVRHAVQAQRHRGGRRHRTDADLALAPQPQRHAGGGGDQAHAQQMVDDLEQADQPHLAMHRDQEVAHRAAGEVGLAPCMREQLDGGDVGVGIADPAGHQRARIRLRATDPRQPRHEPGHRGGVQQQPDHEGQQQPAVEPAGQQRHRHEIDGHEDQDVGQDEGGVAHRQRGLHHLGGDPAGELVLIEGQALAEHQPVEVPAQPHREAAGQRLVLEHRLQRHQRHAAQHDGQQQQQVGAVGGPEPGRIGLPERVDHRAERTEHPGLEGTDQCGAQRHHQDVAAHAGAAVPDEAPQPGARRRDLLGRKRIDPPLEGLKDGPKNEKHVLVLSDTRQWRIVRPGNGPYRARRHEHRHLRRGTEQ